MPTANSSLLERRASLARENPYSAFWAVNHPWPAIHRPLDPRIAVRGITLLGARFSLARHGSRPGASPPLASQSSESDRVERGGGGGEGDRERRRRGDVFLSGVCIIGGSEPESESERWSAEMAIYDALHNTNYLAGATLKGPLDSRRKRGSGDCRVESETVTNEEGQTRCSQRRSSPRRMQPRLGCSVPRGF